jgi:hypothetical protein
MFQRGSWMLGLWVALSLCMASLPVAAQTSDANAGAVTRLGKKANFNHGISLGGKPLVLNGAGIRYKAVFRVYAAGLYLQSKADRPEEVLSTPGPKRMHIVMFRDIDGEELGKLFIKGMEKNASREDFIKCIPGTIKLSEIMSAKRSLNAGDSFTVDFVPGVGTTITVNSDTPSSPIKEPEFFNALLKIWLGEYPADEGLKVALLGDAPR